MKKTTFLLLIFLTTCIPSFAQNAFFDAQYISTLDTGALSKIHSIGGDLKKGTAITQTEIEAINNLIEFINDPFSDKFKQIDYSSVRSAVKKYNDIVSSNIVKTGTSSRYGATSIDGKLFSSLPALLSGGAAGLALSAEQQTKILDAIVKYYAEEFKKAQAITYMQVFQKVTERVGELRIFFPNTIEKLKYADPTKFPDFGKEYKEVFQQDLRDEMDNLMKYIDNYPEGAIPDKQLIFLKARYVSAIRTNKQYPCMRMGMDMLSKLIHDYRTVDLLNYMDDKYYDKAVIDSINDNQKNIGQLSIYQTLTASVHGLNIIQFNLRDTTGAKSGKPGSTWISYEQFKTLNTTLKMKYFIALIYQQDPDYFKAIIGDKIINTIKTEKNDVAKIAYLKTRISPILDGLISIQEFKKNYKADTLKKNLDVYLNHYTTLLLNTYKANILNSIEARIETLKDNVAKAKAEAVATATAELDNAKMELDKLKADYRKYSDIGKHIISCYKSMGSTEYANMTHYLVLLLNDFLKENDSIKERIMKLEEYSGFMSEIVTAKSPDETKDVLKKFVAPPSSYILKRNYRTTLSVTGQPGYFVGIDWPDIKARGSLTSGITLPLGFELTKKLGTGMQNKSSLGLMITLVDLGAVLNFRLGDSSSTLPDKITFKQLFSPGIGLNWGLPNSALTIGIGFQKTSELRKVTLADGNTSYPSGNRIFLRASWDIPMFNIFKSAAR